MNAAIAMAHGVALSACAAYATILARKSAGTPGMRKPKKSRSSPLKMMTAIPLVNPVTTGAGMNLIAPPSFATPRTMRITPAIIVATVSPSTPYCCTMP